MERKQYVCEKCGGSIIYPISSKQRVGILRRFLMSKIKSLLRSVVKHVDLQSFIVGKRQMAGTSSIS